MCEEHANQSRTKPDKTPRELCDGQIGNEAQVHHRANAMALANMLT